MDAFFNCIGFISCVAAIFGGIAWSLLSIADWNEWRRDITLRVKEVEDDLKE